MLVMLKCFGAAGELPGPPRAALDKGFISPMAVCAHSSLGKTSEGHVCSLASQPGAQPPYPTGGPWWEEKELGQGNRNEPSRTFPVQLPGYFGLTKKGKSAGMHAQQSNGTSPTCPGLQGFKGGLGQLNLYCNT